MKISKSANVSYRPGAASNERTIVLLSSTGVCRKYVLIGAQLALSVPVPSWRLAAEETITAIDGT